MFEELLSFVFCRVGSKTNEQFSTCFEFAVDKGGKVSATWQDAKALIATMVSIQGLLPLAVP